MTVLSINNPKDTCNTFALFFAFHYTFISRDRQDISAICFVLARLLLLINRQIFSVHPNFLRSYESCYKYSCNTSLIWIIFFIMSKDTHVKSVADRSYANEYVKIGYRL